MAGKTKLTLIGLLCLAALAGCGNDDVTRPPVVVDTAPPAVPVGLYGEMMGTQVMVHWAPNTTDADLAGYMIYRVNRSRVAVMCDDPVTEAWYLDGRPMIGENTYRVTAVDLNGNESAYTTVTIAVEEEPRTVDPISRNER